MFISIQYDVMFQKMTCLLQSESAQCRTLLFQHLRHNYFLPILPFQYERRKYLFYPNKYHHYIIKVKKYISYKSFHL